MKNKLIYLFVFLCLIIFPLSVKAYDKDTPFYLKEHDRTRIDGIYFISNWTVENAHRNSIYSAQNQNDYGEQYFIYCADPNIPAFYNLQVDHILMGAESRTKAEDYGILMILKNGRWQYTSSTLSYQEQMEYEATSMAIRMFVNAVLGWNYRHTVNAIFPTYIRTAYDLITSDAEMLDAYKEITGQNDPLHILTQFGYTEAITIGFKFKTADATQTGDMAKEILKQGMLAAASYKKGEVQMPEVEVSTAGAGEITETPSGSDTIYERFMVASINLRNFSDDPTNPSYFYYTGIDGQSASTNIQEIGYSFTYSTDETAYSGSLTPTTNIIDLLKNENTDTLYIGYKVKLTSNGSACNSSFNLKYEYNDSKLLNGAMLFPASHAGKDYTSGQRFLMYSSDPISDSHTINSKMCSSYCAPTFEIPHICEDEVDPNKIDAEGNVQYEYREGYKNGSYEIDKCILKNVDSASNQYKLVDWKYAGIVSSNPYCSIYCKEEYSFSVPYKKNVDNGRYFRISMSIKGQQDCYSTKIDSVQYEADIKQAQKDVVTYYNEWMKYYELVNNPLESTGQYDNCYAAVCIGRYNSIPPTCSLNNYLTWYNVSARQEKKQIKFYQTYYVYDESLGIVYASSSATPQPVLFGSREENNIGTCGFNSSGQCDINDQSNTCVFITPEDDYNAKKTRTIAPSPTASNGIDYNVMPTGIYRDPVYTTPDPSLNTESYEYKLEEYEKKLTDAIEKLKTVIDLYNGCIGDDTYQGYSDTYAYPTWNMIYNYDPEIGYSYEEPDPTDYSLDKWIDEVKSITCDDQSCDKMVALEETVYAETCDPDDTKCQNVTSVTTIFDNLTVPTTEYCKDGDLDLKTYECSSPVSPASLAYNSKTYFNCEFDETAGTFSCTNKNYDVTDISYVHKVATAEGKYDTPRVYYSVIPSGGIEISTSEIDNANLVEGLPVGITTPPGTYFYTLSLNNIGTYYSTQELGRIFGTNSTSLSTVERLERQQTINGDELDGNEYACIYTVTQTCTDDAGEVHSANECTAGEDWNTCKERLCPTTGSYCVKEAESYYVCSTQYYDETTCSARPSRDIAIADSSVNFNCCPNCQMLCIGHCIYNLEKYPDPGDLNLVFRPITPAIINPNNREMGYNWDWDVHNHTNVLVAQKAGNTVSEIETRANIDVETATDAELAEIQSYSLKVTMTPAMAHWIKEYNNDHEDDGSYNSETLTCYNFTLPDQSLYPDRETCVESGYAWDETAGTCVMANQFCYSEFITELDNAYDVEVDAPNRDTAINSAHSNYQIYTKLSSLPHQGTGLGSNNYQIHTVNDYWTIYTYTNLDINGDQIPDIGPAWK